MRPCLHCPEKGKCTTERGVRSSIRAVGVRLTTAGFVCYDWQTAIPPGKRVEVEFWTSADGGGESITGTVMGYTKSKRVKVWLDEETSFGHGIVRVWPNDVGPIDEPDVPVCPECGRPAGAANADGWACWKCQGFESWNAQIDAAIEGGVFGAADAHVPHAAGPTDDVATPAMHGFDAGGGEHLIGGD